MSWFEVYYFVLFIIIMAFMSCYLIYKTICETINSFIERDYILLIALCAFIYIPGIFAVIHYFGG